MTVNGIPATVDGTSFSAAGVPLIEGGNTVTATATDANGHVATATVHVVRDLTPPHVVVYHPVDGSTVYDSQIEVHGLVNDIVPGTVNAAQAEVTVNGRTAAVASRSFAAAAIPLVPGSNVIRVAAVDASGNRGDATVNVRLVTVPRERVVALTGNGQSGVIGTRLAQPLVAAVRDAAGNPVAGKQVVFKVTSGDGVFDAGKRLIAVASDAAGEAQTIFTLGKHAGVAVHVVEASVAGFAGPAVFTGSAVPGPPTLIVVDSGGLQVGVTGQRLPRPLVAAVVDVGSNRLGSVPVAFRVRKGTGHLDNGDTTITVPTDGDGRAITTFTLGDDEGTANNVVEARIAGLDDGPFTAFVASGRAAGDPGATSVSGVVVDNTDQPIASVTVRIKHTSLTATTNAQGQFKLERAPVGAIKLIVDGSTAQRPGSWPDLEYDLVTIAGRDTTVNMPIYLLPIDLAGGVYVDETHGATLKLPDFPGFALEIAPGSVTFPSGARSGVVSATVVHNDKVPMVPNFGQQPKLIVTIQPAGARFDPPARLWLPNVDGFAPGHVTEMYSFDHELGHFVGIGPATVRNDGLVIRSDLGVGIVKAGWHCAGDPVRTGTNFKCEACQTCDGAGCEPDPDQEGNTCVPNAPDGAGQLSALQASPPDECVARWVCTGFRCLSEPVKVTDITGPCIGAEGEPLTFTAQANAPEKVKWKAQPGDPPSRTGATFTTTFRGGALAGVVIAGCDPPDQKWKTLRIARACSQVVPQLFEERVCTSPAPAFGEVTPLNGSPTMRECAKNGAMCHVAEKVTIRHKFGVQAPAGRPHPECEYPRTGFIDITGPDDPAINASNCASVIADLTPPPAGADQGPLRSVFFSSAITLAHERVHERQLTDEFATKVFNDFVTFVQQSACSDCVSSPATPNFKAKLDELIQAYNVIWDSRRRNHEVEAHDDSNSLYRRLITEINNRAAREGWSQCH